ncbi:hypothetical protein ACG3SL_05695 [Sphingomonas sp. CJ20]
MSALFHGSALCDVEPDGTVPIPGFVRDALAPGTTELLVGKHQSDDCLVGYDRRQLRRIAHRTERRRRADEARGDDERGHFRRSRRAFGLVDRMPRGETTLRIPAAMRHLGHIGNQALFVGTGERFEIWAPDRALASDDEQFRALAAYRVETRETPDSKQGVH